MKNKITILATVSLLVSVFQVEAQNALYPGIAVADRNYTAPKVTTPPIIDGNPADVAWSAAPWKQAYSITVPQDWQFGGTPVSPEGAFEGVTDLDVKFKMVWDDGHYYILFRYKDDNIIYADNHNGYQRGKAPAYVTVTNQVPAGGAGDGTAYQAFRMDQIAYWFTPYTEALAAVPVATPFYNRNNNGLFHGFMPGQITNSSKPGESVLWGAYHNAPTGAIQNHVGTVAGTFDAAEGVYYIEFRDDTWATLFNSVRTKLEGQKLYGPTVPAAIGDKFLLQGEVNDADGTTNRRDYINYFSYINTPVTPTGLNSGNDLSEALIITLGGPLSTKSQELKNTLKFYVDAQRNVRFDRNVDVEIFNVVGQKVMKSLNASQIDISKLTKGVYIIKDNEGKSGKLIKE